MNPERSIHPEIQGLRAIAVSLVLVFHVWPDRLSGGYVGVDVFFVISGYLITGLLARMAARDGGISLVDFYARRARRLLPAATAVLFATLCGVLVFLPESRWHETATEIAASAVYIQNWVLAWLSTDYLGAEQAASPVQHYWSLSIEEQFYIVWPLVMIGALSVARRLGRPTTGLFVVALSAIFALSLLASIVLTANEPDRAYYVTHTRMWELALGGLLALTIHRFTLPSGARPVLMAGGLAAIGASAIMLTREAEFPGLVALVPTLGAALVILAGNVHLAGLPVLGSRVLGWIGDRSYSIYLWHWPIVVFYVADGERIGWLDGSALILGTLAISHLSFHLIEQRFRHPRRRAEWRPILLGAASIAAMVAAPVALQQSIAARANTAFNLADSRYPGPAALLEGATVPDGVPLLPSLATVKSDLPVVYGRDCHQNQQSAAAISCELGDADGETLAVIVGDSHAAQWVPALAAIAHAYNWRLVALTKSACAFSGVPVLRSGEPYTSCSEWQANALARIEELKADIVFTSQSRRYLRDTETSEMIAGLRTLWSQVIASGARVVAIQDTPWMPFEPADCLANGDRTCTAARADVVATDLFRRAAEGLEDVRVLDLTDGICGADVCRAAEGNLVIWRDDHHLSATYATALAPYFADRLGLSRRAVVQELANRTFVRAELNCSALGSGTPMSRTIQIQIADNEITYRYGDWERRQERFDHWTGTLSDGGVSLSGHYLEGGGGIKDVSLDGRIVDGTLRLDGSRGPRDCELRAEMPPGLRS